MRVARISIMPIFLNRSSGRISILQPRGRSLISSLGEGEGGERKEVNSPLLIVGGLIVSLKSKICRGNGESATRKYTLSLSDLSLGLTGYG